MCIFPPPPFARRKRDFAALEYIQRKATHSELLVAVSVVPRPPMLMARKGQERIQPEAVYSEPLGVSRL